MLADPASSFCEEVEQWLNDEWLPRNQLWQRVCRNADTEHIQNLLYSEEFRSPPRVLCGNSELCLIVEGKSSAEFWRDWLVARLIPDVRSRFPQIGAARLIRCFEQV